MLDILNALAALATMGTFLIAFFDAYEIRIRRRTRTLRAQKGLRRKQRK